MFFSVKQPIKMFGKKFIPCVCYTATKEMLATVEKLTAEGKATMYEEKVFFQNGKLLKSASERKADEKANIYIRPFKSKCDIIISGEGPRPKYKDLMEKFLLKQKEKQYEYQYQICK